MSLGFCFFGAFLTPQFPSIVEWGTLIIILVLKIFSYSWVIFVGRFCCYPIMLTLLKGVIFIPKIQIIVLYQLSDIL